jgi:hypothetical protein
MTEQAKWKALRKMLGESIVGLLGARLDTGNCGWCQMILH